jgi:hypothetical protein
MLSSAPAKPVAVWHDLNFSCYLISEIGPITGTPITDLSLVLRRQGGPSTLLAEAQFGDGVNQVVFAVPGQGVRAPQSQGRNAKRRELCW